MTGKAVVPIPGVLPVRGPIEPCANAGSSIGYASHERFPCGFRLHNPAYWVCVRIGEFT